MKLPQHILDLNPELANLPRSIVVSTSPYRSKLEERAAKEVSEWIFNWWMYEPFVLKFPGGSYTPDFFGELLTGKLAVIEIKGWNKNLRADKLKFSAAYEAHKRWLSFGWMTYSKENGWEVKWND